jgi:hypothetical protein
MLTAPFIFWLCCMASATPMFAVGSESGVIELATVKPLSGVEHISRADPNARGPPCPPVGDATTSDNARPAPRIRQGGVFAFVATIAAFASR